MSGNKPSQPSKFRTRNWVKVNDESPRTFEKDHQIKFETSILRSIDYSDAYVLLSGTITIDGAGEEIAAKQLDERNKGVIS